MVATVRLFVAIEIPPELTATLVRLQDALRPRLPGARWVSRENLHLTLRFIGDTAADRLPGMREGLRRLVRIPPFELNLRGLGAFPNVRRPRALWIGADPLPTTLLKLHRGAETALRALGVTPDARPFRAHATIARFKRPEPRLADAICVLGDPPGGRMSVRRVSLFESRLSSSGAKYHALERYELAGTNREQLV